MVENKTSMRIIILAQETSVADNRQLEIQFSETTTAGIEVKIDNRVFLLPKEDLKRAVMAFNY